MKTLISSAARELGVKSMCDEILFLGKAHVTFVQENRPFISFTSGNKSESADFLFGYFGSLDLDDLMGIHLDIKDGRLAITLIGTSNYHSTVTADFEDVEEVFTLLPENSSPAR